MIILAPGALDKVFSAETSPARDAAAGPDSRFSNWLKSAPQGSAAAHIANGGVESASYQASTPYRNRLSRFE